MSPAIRGDDRERARACLDAILACRDEIHVLLVALEERMVKLRTEVIAKSLKQHKYTFMEEERCCICQEEYIKGEELGRLDCGHYFHCSCIKQWLTHKNLCPICKNTALNLIT